MVREADELCSELGTLTHNLKLNRKEVLRYLAASLPVNDRAGITGDAHA